MSIDHSLPGTVTVNVTTQNQYEGLPQAYVAIVNVNNLTQAYYVGETDTYGGYIFTSVNNTWGKGSIYKIFVNTTIGEAYSNIFSVEENSTMHVNVILNKIPDSALTPTSTPVPTPDSTATPTTVPVSTPINASVPVNNATPTAIITPAPGPSQNSTNATITPATALPSSTPAPSATPGFEAIIAMVGLSCIGMLQYIKGRK